jgi:hypothetical protein
VCGGGGDGDAATCGEAQSSGNRGNSSSSGGNTHVLDVAVEQGTCTMLFHFFCGPSLIFSVCKVSCSKLILLLTLEDQHPTQWTLRDHQSKLSGSCECLEGRCYWLARKIRGSRAATPLCLTSWRTFPRLIPTGAFSTCPTPSIWQRTYPVPYILEILFEAHKTNSSSVFYRRKLLRLVSLYSYSSHNFHLA